MAKYYGKVKGKGKTEATRLGTLKSGLRTTAASWSGSVTVTLFERGGEEWAEVSLTPWQGKGCNALIYCGPVSRHQHDPEVVADEEGSQHAV